MLLAANLRLFVVCLILVAVTLASWWIGVNDNQSFVINQTITWSVILIAALKVRIIMREFMEVNHGPKILKRLTDAWLLITLLLLMGLYMTQFFI